MKNLVAPDGGEAALRRRLGIPADARRVLVFCESSHWDLNWLRTSEEYYHRHVEPILRTVLDALERDERRVYCVESVFFLKLFWERRPADRERVRRLVARRQLRVASASMTTPDTLLPAPEAVLRDYHLGQRWLREAGLDAEPRTAVFPDSFGHSPHLPSLMRAVGVEAVSLTRVDGMYFVASDWRPRGHFPLPGSTAELLQRVHRTLDFVWRADDGSEVLCHWNAFTYFQGDMLAHAGVVRWMGRVAGFSSRGERAVARRVNRIARTLEPLSRTPYLLCPIGMDFNDPIAELPSLLERHNTRRYGETGTWTVLAGLDDWFALVGSRRAELPVLSPDPNPYWMGHGASRPEAKQRTARIARTLLEAERRSVLDARDEALAAALHDGWSTLVLANHHDFITGTSPDRVWHAEQKPWLEAAERAAERALRLADAAGRRISVAVMDPGTEVPGNGSATALSALRPAERLERCRSARFQPAIGRESAQTERSRDAAESRVACIATALPALRRPERRERCRSFESSAGQGDPCAVSRDGPLVRVETDRVRAVLDESSGGCLTSLDVDGVPALAGLGFDLVSHADEGGLWRLGHEFRGGRFAPVARASDRPATIREETGEGEATLVVEAEVDGSPFVRRLTLRRGESCVRLSVEGAAPRRRTITCAWRTSFATAVLEMDTVGGTVERPHERHYSPTFWTVPSFARLRGEAAALALRFEAPAAVSSAGNGAVEWIVARNAVKERAFGFLPVLAHPIGGTSDEAVLHRATIAVELPSLRTARSAEQEATVRCDDASVSVTALKHADDGDGIVVRLACGRVPEAPIRVSFAGGPLRAAVLCDALERDLAPIEVSGGCAVVHLRGRLTTVRLRVR